MTANDETNTAPDYEPTGRPARRTRVLVVDDHPGVRRGIVRLISANGDFEVVGEAADGAEAVHLVPEVAPDLVLMDVSMPVLDGVAATALIARLPDPPAVLLFTAWAQQDRIAEAMSAGASGHVLKDALPVELFEAIHAALAAPRPAPGGDASRVPGRDHQSSGALPHGALPLGTRPAGHRRWQLRVAGGAAAMVAVGTVGVAAAGEGRLPPAIQHAAQAVGLPAPANRVDQARQALARLKVALRDGNPTTIAAAADQLRHRLADLKASDQAAVGASGALWVADQQLKSPVADVGSSAPPPAPPASSGSGNATAATTGTMPARTDDHGGATGGSPGGPPPTGGPSGGSPGGPPPTGGPSGGSPGGPPPTAAQNSSPGRHGGGPPSASSGSRDGSNQTTVPSG